MPQRSKDTQGKGARRIILDLLFHRAFGCVMSVIILPLMVAGVIGVAAILQVIRDQLYLSMPRNTVDALMPFIGCLIGGLAWLLVGYIAYRIMVVIRRVAGEK